MKKTLYQAEIPRIIMIYVFLGILVIYFSIITYKVLKRKRQRLNLVLSGFFISLIIGFLLNMVYAAMTDRITILILNFLTNYFIFFGPVFLLIVNMIILESTLIYSVRKQNRYILFYGITLFAGMLILVLLGGIIDPPNVPFLGVQIINNVPKWGLIFFIYVASVMSIFTMIPINYTNFKIYFQFETKALKRKWFFYLFGFLGLSVILYFSIIFNILDPIIYAGVRLMITLSISSVIIWGYMMYYGIGIELKD
ncbi:MAG: hypothetical protein ACFE9N_04560 [Promethearchaeota archaeon]